MKAKVMFLKILDKSGELPFAVVKENPKPGDYSHKDGALIQVNQSTCIYSDEKVIMPYIRHGVKVNPGEEIEIRFLCAKRESCNYPFCGKACPGNDDFFVVGKEQRPY